MRVNSCLSLLSLLWQAIFLSAISALQTGSSSCAARIDRNRPVEVFPQGPKPRISKGSDRISSATDCVFSSSSLCIRSRSDSYRASHARSIRRSALNRKGLNADVRQFLRLASILNTGKIHGPKERFFGRPEESLPGRNGGARFKVSCISPSNCCSSWA